MHRDSKADLTGNSPILPYPNEWCVWGSDPQYLHKFSLLDLSFWIRRRDGQLDWLLGRSNLDGQEGWPTFLLVLRFDKLTAHRWGCIVICLGRCHILSRLPSSWIRLPETTGAATYLALTLKNRNNLIFLSSYASGLCCLLSTPPTPSTLALRPARHEWRGKTD